MWYMTRYISVISLSSRSIILVIMKFSSIQHVQSRVGTGLSAKSLLEWVSA